MNTKRKTLKQKRSLPFYWTKQAFAAVRMVDNLHRQIEDFSKCCQAPVDEAVSFPVRNVRYVSIPGLLGNKQ